MKVFILGGYGEVGKPAAKLLAKNDLVTHITIAGRNLERAQKTAAEIGEKASAAQVDSANDQDLNSALAGHDLILNGGPRDSVIPSIKAAIRNKIHYCDPAGPTIHPKAKQLSQEAEEAGIFAVIAAGTSPCVSNMMGIHAARHLDKVKQFQVGMVELINMEKKLEFNPKDKLWSEDPATILSTLQDYKPFIEWMLNRLQENGSTSTFEQKDDGWVKSDPIINGVAAPLTKGGYTRIYPYYCGYDAWGMTPIEIADEKPIDLWSSPFSPQLDTILRGYAKSVLHGEVDSETAVNAFYKLIEGNPARWLESPSDGFQISKMWVCALGEKQGKPARSYSWFTDPMWSIDGYYLTSVAMAAAVNLILAGKAKEHGVYRAEKAFAPLPFLDEVASLISDDLPDGKLFDESFEWDQ